MQHQQSQRYSIPPHWSRRHHSAAGVPAWEREAERVQRRSNFIDKQGLVGALGKARQLVFVAPRRRIVQRADARGCAASGCAWMQPALFGIGWLAFQAGVANLCVKQDAGQGRSAHQAGVDSSA